jgi:nicotinamide mononucleotide transporter
MNDFSLLGQSTGYIELIAMLTGIAGVYLTIKQSVWCFPVGIINVAIYAWLFSSPGVRLYADALLQCIYILLLFYGWYNWSTKNTVRNTIMPGKLSKAEAIKLSGLFVVSTCTLAIFLEQLTDASYPWLDSALTCGSLAAQWLIAKKKIENWMVWIIVDLIYIPLYYVKHLPLTSSLYAIFLLMAVKGYYEWRKIPEIHES